MGRLLALAASLGGFMLWLWYGGVRNVGRAKARKRRRRAPSGS
jgi:hypothetical protein